MKKYNLILVLLFVVVNSVLGQQKVARHSNGTVMIYGGANPFNDAYTAAINGDTLYLPGGSIPSPPILNKRLTIIGAGHYPDSTVATQKTIIGNITISQDADRLYLEGIEMGNITISTNHKVDSMIITRCRFHGINYQGTGATPCVENVLSQNVIIDDVYLTNCTNSIISNNFIGGRIVSSNHNGISNNILFYNTSGSWLFSGVNSCFISNNIIFSTRFDRVISGNVNTLSNNILTLFPTTGNNTFTNNYQPIPIAGVFVNQSGNSFDYSHDYHLLNPEIYVGTDGTQVGIYGGLYPYKEGAVPQNPHIQFINVAPTTDANGNLNIQFKVKAQNK